MIEIEVKAIIHDSQKIIHSLEAMGCTWGEKIWQHDTVYLPKDFIWSITGNSKLKVPVMRIRREKGGSKLTMKIPLEVTLANHEIELDISDPEAMEVILMQLGYNQQIAMVEKTRRKTKWQDFEICVDAVVGLGDFVEVETFSDFDPTLVQEDLFLFLERLGIARENRVNRGYDVLVWAKDRGMDWQNL